VVNFMALLGWTPPDGSEFLSLPEIIERFSIDRVTKAPSVFDPEKLTWMNANYIRRLDRDDLARRCLPFLERAGLVAEGLAEGGGAPEPPEGMVRSDFARVAWVVGLEQERIETLAQIAPATEFFFKRDIEYDKQATKILRAEGVGTVLRRALEVYGSSEDWRPEPMEAVGRNLVAELGLPAKSVFQPIRAAVTGRLASPPLFDTMAALGRDLCLERLSRAVEFASGEGD